MIQEKDSKSTNLQQIKINHSIKAVNHSMENSILRVTILEAQNLTPLSYKIANNSFVCLNCDGLVARTKTAPSTNPKWNETFELS